MTFEPDYKIGAYTVVRLLGQGGMGAVYEVEHAELGTHYALKTFGFGFLLDAAKLAIGVSVMAVQNIRNCGRTPSENAPKIVSVTPADGAKDVDPNLGEIAVCFDRPMNMGWSLTGDGWPTLVGTPEFDSAMTNLTIRVALKPETEYTLGFNSRSHKKFASSEGVPLVPCVCTFRTK